LIPGFDSRRLLLARLAFRNIRLNWRHSLATMLAIMGGFAAVSLFDGFLLALHEYNEEHYVNKGMVGHVIIEREGAAEHILEDLWGYSLSKEDQSSVVALLDGDQRVEASMRYLLLTGLISNGKTNSLFIGSGLEEENGVKIRGEGWAWNTIAGLPLYRSPNPGLIMGSGLAQRLGCTFDPKVIQNKNGTYLAEERKLDCPGKNFQLSVTTEHSQVNAADLPVSGVTDFQLREFNDKVLVMPLEHAQRLFDTDRISRYVVLLKNPNMIPAFVRDIRARAKERNLPLEAIPWIEHPVASMAKGGLEVMDVFRGLFLSVVAVIAAMSVANSMMKSINERIREIGTFRSFGFRRRDIIWLFSLEGLFLGFFSCLGGIAVTSLLAFVISNLGLTFNAGVLSTPMPLNFSMAFLTWVTTLATLSLITFLASWLVSRKAAQMVVADALRYIA